MPKKISGKKPEKTEKKIAEKPKKITEKEFEKKVLELVKKGLTSEKIGEALRKEKIHPKEFSKKISVILKENNAFVDPDLKNAEEKLEKIKKHFESNKQDKGAMRDKDRIFAKIRKLKIYRKIPLKSK